MAEESTPSEKPPENFIIPARLVLGLLNYLAQRPYIEVHLFIPQLQNLEKYDMDSDER